MLRDRLHALSAEPARNRLWFGKRHAVVAVADRATHGAELSHFIGLCLDLIALPDQAACFGDDHLKHANGRGFERRQTSWSLQCAASLRLR